MNVTLDRSDIGNVFTFEEAVDLSVDALKKQLVKAKEKQRD